MSEWRNGGSHPSSLRLVRQLKQSKQADAMRFYAEPYDSSAANSVRLAVPVFVIAL
jgi:hypothetical protein